MWLRWSEPKDEPNRVVLEGSGGFLAWLVRHELIGRIAVVDLDLEEEANPAKEQWQHLDPGAD